MFILSLSINGVSAIPAEISVSPESQNVEVGQEFSINIMIDPANEQTAGAQFNLIFDSSLAEIKSVAQGNFFKKNGIASYFNKGTPAANSVIDVWSVIITPGASVTAKGSFATIIMYAKKAGTVHHLDLAKVIVSDPGGRSIPVTLKNGTVIISDPGITAPPAATVNFISNPGFESGTSPWLFYTSGSGSFTAVSPGYEGVKASKIAIGSRGNNIQLYQKGITVESNTRYRLSFAAYSTTGHDLTVNLIKQVSPYTNYGLTFTPDIGKSWQTFTTEFTTKGFTGTVNDGRLRFQLGGFASAGDIYYIDDVKLEKVNSPSPTAGPVAPSIVTQPSDQNVATGQMATFSVVAVGTAPLNYQWQRNGVDIPGANGATYMTSPTVMADDGAKFSVVVTNSAGSAGSNVVMLTVLQVSTSINLISNPGFESGTNSWNFWTNGVGTLSVLSPGYEGTKASKIAIGSAGTNIQLYQKGITLKPNTRYRLSFAAYSMTGHDLTVNLIKQASPYTNYGLTFTPDLRTNWQVFTIEFTTRGFTGTVNDGRFRFQLGGFAGAGDVYFFDDIRLEKVNASLLQGG